jgi:hypothetical protein
MQALQFPSYQFRFKSKENKTLIFDEVRKKFVVLTPEEWVRQHTLQYLILNKGYSRSLIAVERQIALANTVKRYDIVVFDTAGKVTVIVECKAPHIAISQQTFDQIARYNLNTQAQYLMVTNGISHYFCQMDYQNERYIFLEQLPNSPNQTRQP